jgi:hypothetical protein
MGLIRSRVDLYLPGGPLICDVQLENFIIIYTRTMTVFLCFVWTLPLKDTDGFEIGCWVLVLEHQMDGDIGTARYRLFVYINLPSIVVNWCQLWPSYCDFLQDFSGVPESWKIWTLSVCLWKVYWDTDWELKRIDLMIGFVEMGNSFLWLLWFDTHYGLFVGSAIFGGVLWCHHKVRDFAFLDPLYRMVQKCPHLSEVRS